MKNVLSLDNYDPVNYGLGPKVSQTPEELRRDREQHDQDCGLSAFRDFEKTEHVCWDYHGIAPHESSDLQGQLKKDREQGCIYQTVADEVLNYTKIRMGSCQTKPVEALDINKLERNTNYFFNGPYRDRMAWALSAGYRVSVVSSCGSIEHITFIQHLDEFLLLTPIERLLCWGFHQRVVPAEKKEQSPKKSPYRSVRQATSSSETEHRQQVIAKIQEFSSRRVQQQMNWVRKINPGSCRIGNWYWDALTAREQHLKTEEAYYMAR